MDGRKWGVVYPMWLSERGVAQSLEVASCFTAMHSLGMHGLYLGFVERH